ncbi:MAG: DegT/DnrJ/EryC1/StrS family aminotransferase [Deltaproteobacteria bacterium]|nr:DegT/DnrJ/EryC1/StrS family aminotransferase [Deltaproteobacteria bacterium]
MLDLSAQHSPIREELRQAMDRVMDSQAFIMGPDVAAFEAEMSKDLGVKHAIGCANGSDALVLALQALDVGPGSEVITTTFSFFATAGAIARLGARPVFADIDPETFNLDADDVERKLSSKTKAIMPVHLFGQMTPMGPVMELAKKHGVRVVEDAAQAVGSREGSSAAGTVGDAGTLSFFPSKNLGCMGDGGMVLTNDDRVAARVRSLRVHGSGKVRYHHEEVGMNSRLDTLQAAILRVKLPHLSRWTEGRQRVARAYDELLGSTPGIVTPKRLPGMHHIYNQYTLRVPNRDALEAKLKSEKIGCAVYYPVALHLQRCFAQFGGSTGHCPVAEKAVDEVLSIPVYGELTDSQIERIASVVKSHVA